VSKTQRNLTIALFAFVLLVVALFWGVLEWRMQMSAPLAAGGEAFGEAALWAAIVAGSIALASSWGLAALTLRPLREMRRVSAAMAEGRYEERMPPVAAGTDLNEISRAVNQMARQLREQLEQALRESQQLQAVLESMVEGVLLVDADGRILVANSRLREWYGVGEGYAGRQLIEAIGDPVLDAILAEAAEEGGLQPRSIRLGGLQPRELQVYAVRFPSEGERLGTVAVLHDVTELLRLEGVRRDFVSNASHELRTPVTAIRGFAETLLAAPKLEDSEGRGYLEIIERNSIRLANIVDDLLELSTIESGGHELAPVPLDAGALSRRVARDYQERAHSRELSLGVSVEGESPAWANPEALERVLVNLLDNAFKYTDAGGSVEIRVSAGSVENRIDVADTGIGIPEADRSRIFERFYRVDKARSRALGGTGLGLAIVKHLVNGMGGEIGVSSTLGKGSTFRFTLPSAPPT